MTASLKKVLIEMDSLLFLLPMSDEVEKIYTSDDAEHHEFVRCFVVTDVCPLRGHDESEVLLVEDLSQLSKRGLQRDLPEVLVEHLKEEIGCRGRSKN